MSEWIKLKERIPAFGTWVFVVANGHVQKVACRLSPLPRLEWEWIDSEADPCPFDVVTYWMPLPEPPK